MESPFPGMDPYLEGYLWPDVHHKLASVVAELLGPQISPKYVARVDVYTVHDTSPEEEIGIMYPDVEILKRKAFEAPVRLAVPGEPLAVTPATLSIPGVSSVRVRIPVVEIRDVEKNRLIAAIEFLSPVNKRKPGLEPYRQKRESLHQAGVHLLEIDLLRRGTRPFAHPYLPKSHYLVTLMRASQRSTDVWAIPIQDRLPVLPVPLVAPDRDAALDLQMALQLTYARSLYHLSIDYAQIPPPPAFDEPDLAWIHARLEVRG